MELMIEWLEKGAFMGLSFCGTELKRPKKSRTTWKKVYEPFFVDVFEIFMNE